MIGQMCDISTVTYIIARLPWKREVFEKLESRLLGVAWLINPGTVCHVAVGFKVALTW